MQGNDEDATKENSSLKGILRDIKLHTMAARFDAMRHRTRAMYISFYRYDAFDKVAPHNFLYNNKLATLCKST